VNSKGEKSLLVECVNAIYGTMVVRKYVPQARGLEGRQRLTVHV
jgi:hypothetical protein